MGVRPTVIRNEDQLAQLLRGRRLALDISQAELDHRIGWPESYTAKVEAPARAGANDGRRGYGRRVIWGLSMLLVNWADSLGLALVLMAREDAERFERESDEPPMDAPVHTPYPNRARQTVIFRERVLTSSVVLPV
jgi:hypothetical protein